MNGSENNSALRTPHSALIVSYYFPPAGGPGVQRVLKHVKFLREFGYEPVVIAAAPEDYCGLSELRMPTDESISAEVPERIEVHRVKSRQPFRLFAWLHKWRIDYLRELLFVPDTAVTWIRPVVKRAREVAAKRRIDLIYTSVKPHSVAFAGWLLKRALRKPWVLDFRDPWTQYFLATFPTRLHFRLEQWLEQFLLRRADHIVTITPTARANLLAWCDFLPPDKVSCITNGYDEEDFDAQAITHGRGNGSCEDTGPPLRSGYRNFSVGPGTALQQPDREAGQSRELARFSLLYTGVFCGAPAPSNSGKGSLVERMWRGLRNSLTFTPRHFDRLTHSPKFLFDALRELFNERPDLRGRIKLIHVGPRDEANARYARELGIADAFETHGYVAHGEAVQLASRADAVFFCLADSPVGERNDCVPQKVYEYLGSRRPVLALVPEGDARDFLKRAGTAIVCDPRDLGAIKDGLMTLIEHRTQLRPDDEFIGSFRRRNQTAQLAGIFDRLTAR